jgi:hypothetical protein
MAALREFSLPAGHWWRSSIPWGGGHTPQTDPGSITKPVSERWRLAHGEGSGPDVVLGGRKGRPGCFSVRPLSGGTLDLAVYLETPEEVSAAWQAGVNLDPSYHEITNVPGWGLVAIELVEAELRAYPPPEAA